MIKYSNEEGFIKASGIKFKDNQNKNIILPRVAVGVFSRYLFKDVIQKFNCREVGYISCANMEKDIYILNYKGEEITFFMAGVSGPWISADIEELSAQGVEKFIIFGNCGVLDSKIEDCSIIIPTMAFRDEGTSYHYVEDSETIDLNPKYINEFIEILDKMNFDQVNQFVDLLVQMNNNTRKITNRGFTPNEMGMGILPKQSNHKVINIEDACRKKIYANDPCPCGSGKKYKKCCGKKK